MCKYCEKMKPLLDLTFYDGVEMNVTLCPLPTKSFIQVNLDSCKNNLRGYGVYERAFFVDYCPKCGRKLNESI